MNNALARNTGAKVIDNLPILALVPAAIVGWLLGRLVGSGAAAVFLIALIAAGVRYGVMKARSMKLKRQAAYLERVHADSETLAAAITHAVGELEQANQDLGFAEATFGTALMVRHRAAVNEAYAQAQTAWQIQENLASFDGTQQLDAANENARAIQLCDQILSTTAKQAKDIDGYQAALDDAPNSIATLQRELANYEIKLGQSRATVSSLGLADANSLIRQAEAVIAGAKQQGMSLQSANTLDDKGSYLSLLDSQKRLLNELSIKINTIDSYVNRVIAQREQARQEEARALAQKVEQERLIALAQQLDKNTSEALDKVPGLGPKRRDALLNHFGTLAAIRKATPHELERVNTIGPSLAAEIWRAMQGVR